MLNQIANADHPLEALVEFALQQKGAAVTLRTTQCSVMRLFLRRRFWLTKVKA